MYRRALLASILCFAGVSACSASSSNPAPNEGASTGGANGVSPTTGGLASSGGATSSGATGGTTPAIGGTTGTGGATGGAPSGGTAGGSSARGGAGTGGAGTGGAGTGGAGTGGAGTGGAGTGGAGTGGAGTGGAGTGGAGTGGAGGTTGGSVGVSGIITVAQDGSGDVTTIQAGIDRVPDGNAAWKIILIKNGVYAEHVFIDKSFVALVGESRSGARVELALDRSVWNSDRGVTNTGSGVIDIGVDSVTPTKKVTVSDVFIGNISIINTIDTSTATGTIYTHAIRGETSANRIWVVHSDVLATGSDTLALWNNTAGMYYHASCKFQGGIDAVCPRGWAYDADSTYIETKSSAPIWHEGVAGSTQRFVIRNAYVQPDVARNIKLLNGQDQSTIYLLDSYFYNSGGKTTAEGTVSAAYFDNCHMEGGDQAWHADNLATAPGAPTPAQITAAWTFDGQWDPEASFPAVLPYAAIPHPWNKARDVPGDVQLAWAKARDAQSYEVYLDTANPPAARAGTATANSYGAAALSAGTTYYWRVDTVSAGGTVPGTVWTFTTAS